MQKFSTTSDVSSSGSKVCYYIAYFIASASQIFKKIHKVWYFMLELF